MGLCSAGLLFPSLLLPGAAVAALGCRGFRACCLGLLLACCPRLRSFACWVLARFALRPASSALFWQWWFFGVGGFPLLGVVLLFFSFDGF